MAIIDRIFADSYQFYIYDSDYDHYSDPQLEWRDENRLEYGYMATDRAVYVSTVAHLNDHRVRVFIDESPRLDDYERSFTRTLHIESGRLVVSAIGNFEDDNMVIQLEPSLYTLQVCANSIGRDALSDGANDEDDFMEDEEYFKHDDFEYYDLYIKKIGQVVVSNC